MIGRAAGWLGNLRAGAEDGREKEREEAEGARGHNAKKNDADASPVVTLLMCWNFFYIISII